MEKILELLKTQLDESKKLTSGFTETEASFREGVESGLERAIEIVEKEIESSK